MPQFSPYRNHISLPKNFKRNSLLISPSSLSQSRTKTHLSYHQQRANTWFLFFFPQGQEENLPYSLILVGIFSVLLGSLPSGPPPRQNIRRFEVPPNRLGTNGIGYLPFVGVGQKVGSELRYRLIQPVGWFGFSLSPRQRLDASCAKWGLDGHFC